MNFRSLEIRGFICNQRLIRSNKIKIWVPRLKFTIFERSNHNTRDIEK